MKTLLFVLGAILFTAATAMADQTCYSPAELEAEHLLRLHSELMVITITCRQGSEGESLTPAYTGFTKRNIATLHKAEHTLVNYFNEQGRSGQDELDHLRTKLANEFGQRIANMSSQPFCDAYRDKVLEYYRASPGAIETEIQRMDVSERSYIPPCEGRTRIAKHP